MKKSYLYQNELNGVPVVRLYAEGFCVGLIDKGEVYLQGKYEKLAKKLCKFSKKSKMLIEVQEGADQNFANLRALHNRYLELLNSKK